MLKIIIITFFFSLDVISKQTIFYSIDLNTFVPLVFFLDLTHIHNYGISFGLFSGLISSWVFVSIGILLSFIIFYMFLISKNKMEKWGLLMILTGAISNIVDRFISGYVLDFIYLHYKEFYWPAFNFADIYISIGVLIIILQIIKDFDNRKHK